MSERKESSVLFSLQELAGIESDRIKREEEERKRREEEERRRQEEEARRRREEEVRAQADAEARRAREEAEKKAQEERERLEIELAAQRAREEVERQAAIERARLAAQKAGRPFDPNMLNAPPKSNGALIGGISALAVALVGAVVYFAAFRDDGVTILVPSPTIAIQKTIVETKTVEVPAAAPQTGGDSSSAKKPQPSRPKANPTPTKKKCPPSDPLCGVDL